MPAHTTAWNELSPAGSDLASSIDDFMRAMKLDIRERLALEHNWNSATAEGNTQDGHHKEITITPATTNTPLLKTNANQSLTGSNASACIDLGITWNTTGAPSAIKVNVTNTASDVTSKLIDLQTGGVSQFSVSRSGNIVAAGNTHRLGGSAASNPIIAINGATGGAIEWQLAGVATGRITGFNGHEYWDSDGAWNFRTLAANILNAQITAAGSLLLRSGILQRPDAAGAAIAAGSGTNTFYGTQEIRNVAGSALHWQVPNHILPGVNDTYDIGSTSLRVRVVYATSLNAVTLTTTGGLTVGGVIDIPKSAIFSFATDLDTGITSDSDNSINLEVGGVAGWTITGAAGAPITGGTPFGAMGATAAGSYIEFGHNSSGSGAAGCLGLRAANGTPYVLWVDTAGKLRIGTARPTANGSVADTSGTIVGLQV